MGQTERERERTKQTGAIRGSEPETDRQTDRQDETAEWRVIEDSYEDTKVES